MNPTHDPFATTLVKLRAYALRPATRRDPAPEELQALEDELGVSLPEPYRSFVQRWGRYALSSVPRFAFTAAGDPARSAAISQFFGFSTDGTSDLVHALRAHAEAPSSLGAKAALQPMASASWHRASTPSCRCSRPTRYTTSRPKYFLQLLTPDPVYDEETQGPPMKAHATSRSGAAQPAAPRRECHP
jgi:hypothetical protein